MKRVFVCIVAALILMVNLTISVNANSTAFDLNYFIQQYKELLVERSPEEAIAAKARADALGASEIELNLAEKYYNAYLADVYDGDEIPVMSTRSVQLNTTFVNRFGALQDLARTYVNSLETDGSYDFDVDDEYNGMKDVWYCFYFLRYLAVDSNGERRYMNDLWNYGGSSDVIATLGACTENGGEGSFPAYVQENDSALYLFLNAAVNSNNVSIVMEGYVG